jgi:hypothetical protein
MRQIDSPPPNLGQSRGPYRGIGSKDWLPRTSAARVGGIIFGTVYVAGGLMMFVASYALKHELQNLISSPQVAFVVSLVAVTMSGRVCRDLVGQPHDRRQLPPCPEWKRQSLILR